MWKKLFYAFIDYKKAFDCVDRSCLWLKLLNCNVNGKVLSEVQSLYYNAKSCVRVGNTNASYFPCNVAVRQGETFLHCI